MRYGSRALLISTVLALAVTAGPAASGGEWVSSEGRTHSLDDGEHVFLAEEGGTTFDLAELADGETRSFGGAGKSVTAARRGDEVRLTTDGPSGSRDLVCVIGRDRCRVVTFEGDPGKVMLVVRKVRSCDGGGGDCDGPATVDVDLDVLHGGEVSLVTRVVRCEDPGDCALVKHVATAAGDTVVLRCPEGDTTMRVTAEELDETFLCPKHAVQLVESREARVHAIHIETLAEESED